MTDINKLIDEYIRAVDIWSGTAGEFHLKRQSYFNRALNAFNQIQIRTDGRASEAIEARREELENERSKE